MTKLTMFAAAAALAALAGCTSDPSRMTSETASNLTGSGSGEDLPPQPPPPTSTITVTYSDGNPTSQNPGPPSMGWRCQIPKGVLDTLPIYNGGPVMRNCEISVSVSGNPPTSMTTLLDCNNATGTGGYDQLSCTMSLSLGLAPSPPRARRTSTGRWRSASRPARSRP
ncbi:MAG: hypothetical protein E6J90_46695 [Deltaproteobacteria bacterium]|nr:MAG: hypothetical protein E6J90_46695 [Deltaproteobacteria bacterium]